MLLGAQSRVVVVQSFVARVSRQARAIGGRATRRGRRRERDEREHRDARRAAARHRARATRDPTAARSHAFEGDSAHQCPFVRMVSMRIQCAGVYNTIEGNHGDANRRATRIVDDGR